MEVKPAQSRQAVSYSRDARAAGQAHGETPARDVPGEAPSAAAPEKAAKENKEPQRKDSLQESLRQMQEKQALFQMFQTQTASTANDAFSVNVSEPKDTSARLTQRLVSACGQFQVRQMIAEAGGEMFVLRLIAALGGENAEKAKAYLKKLDRFIVRAERKIKDLDREDDMRLRKKSAERKKQQKRAEEIKNELRKQRICRQARENGYLIEQMQDMILGLKPHQTRRRTQETARLDVASEAAISAEAEAIAEAEVAGGGEAAGEAAAPEIALDGAGPAELSGGGEAELPEGGGE